MGTVKEKRETMINYVNLLIRKSMGGNNGIHKIKI
jgi:hypothetical protein